MRSESTGKLRLEGQAWTPWKFIAFCWIHSFISLFLGHEEQRKHKRPFSVWTKRLDETDCLSWSSPPTWERRVGFFRHRVLLVALFDIHRWNVDIFFCFYFSYDLCLLSHLQKENGYNSCTVLSSRSEGEVERTWEGGRTRPLPCGMFYGCERSGACPVRTMPLCTLSQSAFPSPGPATWIP